MTMLTTDHRRYQRRLRWLGIIPPAALTRPTDCKACGHPFAPVSEGVTRWDIDGRTLWQAACPSCQSHQTVHTVNREEG